eukprot:6295582-Amphidinium_carterae.1
MARAHLAQIRQPSDFKSDVERLLLKLQSHYAVVASAREYLDCHKRSSLITVKSSVPCWLSLPMSTGKWGADVTLRAKFARTILQ